MRLVYGQLDWNWERANPMHFATPLLVAKRLRGPDKERR